MFDNRRPLQIFLTATLVCLFVFSSTVRSELTYPEDSGIFISDEAEVLNLTEKQQLNQVSDDLEYDTGTVIVIVTVNSSTDYASGQDENMSLGDYAGALFDEWKVGDQDYRDGVLILLATNQSGNGYDWTYTGGDHWLEYWDVLDDWDKSLPDSFYSNLNDSNWSSALVPMLQDLDEVVREFWFENPNIEPFPPERDDFTTTPTLDGQQNDDATAGGGLFAAACCLGGLGVAGLVLFLIARGGSAVSGRFAGGGGGAGWNNNQYGYPNDVGYQQNNHYYGGGNNTPQQSPPPSSGSGGSSRGGSSSRRSGGGRRGK